jgi:hypothetical protein
MPELDGIELLRLCAASAFQPRIIFHDLVMPRLDGAGGAAGRSLPDIGFIRVSLREPEADGKRIDNAQSMPAWMTHLIKPVSLDVLKNVLGALDVSVR